MGLGYDPKPKPRLVRACPKPSSTREARSWLKALAWPCASIAPPHSTPEPASSERASTRSTAAPARIEVLAKSAEKASEAIRPYLVRVRARARV